MIPRGTNWVVLARIVRPHGRQGQVIAEIHTDFPSSFAERKRLFLQFPTGDGVREAQLEASSLHKGRVVLKFAGVDSIDDAERLRGCLVMLPAAERMPLREGSVYVSDLLDAQVIDVHGGAGRETGVIIDVLPEGLGPAMLVLNTGSAEPTLIPFVKAYLKNIDLQRKRVEMDLPEGFLTMQAPLTAEEWRQLRQEEGEKAEDAKRAGETLKNVPKQRARRQ